MSENENKQGTYSVAVYATVHARLSGIPASVGSAQAAAQYANAHMELSGALQVLGPVNAGDGLMMEHAGFSDEVQGFLVDVPEDPEYMHSERFGSDATGPMVGSAIEAEEILRGLAELPTLEEGGQFDRKSLDTMVLKARATLGVTGEA